MIPAIHTLEVVAAARMDDRRREAEQWQKARQVRRRDRDDRGEGRPANGRGAWRLWLSALLSRPQAAQPRA